MKGPRRHQRSRNRSGRSGISKASKNPVSVGEEYSVIIEDVTRHGKGVAKIKGFVIVVSNTSLGDRAVIRITKITHGHAEAKVLNQSMDTNTKQEISDKKTQ